MSSLNCRNGCGTSFECAYPDCLLVNWTIEKNPKPIPTTAHDWDFVHVDYDGAPSGDENEPYATDNRCGTAPSYDDAVKQIIEIEEESGT